MPKDIIVHMKKFATDKKLKELLAKINPLLTKKEENVRIHLEELVQQEAITEEEFKTIESKMRLSKLCLDLEEQIKDGFVTMMFYDWNENNIYHGAAPSFAVDFFDFYHKINRDQLFNVDFGTCGKSIFKQEVAVGDVLTSSCFAKYREYYQQYGFRTIWSIPFYKDDRVVGTFAIYHKHEKQVTQQEVDLVKKKVTEYQDSIFQMSNQLLSN